MTRSTPLLRPAPLLEPAPPLPENITPIDSQASLYGYGVAMFGFVEVAGVAEAVERAEGRWAFLLKSKILPVYYLIFPHVIVEPKKGTS
jgi:hypothetical protein